RYAGLMPARGTLGVSGSGTGRGGTGTGTGAGAGAGAGRGICGTMPGLSMTVLSLPEIDSSSERRLAGGGGAGRAPVRPIPGRITVFGYSSAGGGAAGT